MVSNGQSASGAGHMHMTLLLLRCMKVTREE
jgi:hypothetical protein